MAKFTVPEGWEVVAYRFEVDRPGRHPEIASHQGARRFAWNWARDLVEEQLRVREAFRVLALRQGARAEEAEGFAEEAAALSYLVELEESRRKVHEARAGKKAPYQPVSVAVPWSAPAMRYVWNRVKDEVAPWWGENSKECYSSAFEALSRAFGDHFSSRDGGRKGPRVGWPRPKGRRGQQSTSFTTGAVKVLDRHHVQLPVVGVLRTKEQTDKLRLRLEAGTARALRATLVTKGSRTWVSFGVAREKPAKVTTLSGVAGHDVGVHALLVSSDGTVTGNPKAFEGVEKKVSRYQRHMDRQHRAGSPRCFNSDGTHVQGACYWRDRSRRAREAQHRLSRAHQEAADVRADAVHKASHQAAGTYAVNVVEDLGVSQLGRKGNGKRGFNRAWADASPAEHRRQLSYKCPRYGSALWLAARWYPSSKLCSGCRAKKPHLSRNARVFHCDSCGLAIDRDLNAARNLAALAELAVLCRLAQLVTGVPVDWSHLPVRPDGWEVASTRSSRGCARAGGQGNLADGGEVRRRSRKTSVTAETRSFDREAAEPPTGALVPEVA